MRGMLDGGRPTAAGPRYRAVRVRNDPLPVQQHLPILVGGQGERITLRLVAQYADACNLSGSANELRHKDLILQAHCAENGRDAREIERTTCVTAIIRASRSEATRVLHKSFEQNGGAQPWEGIFAGPPEYVVDSLPAYMELGSYHFVFEFPAPYDQKTMVRLISDVKPALDRLAA